MQFNLQSAGVTVLASYSIPNQCFIERGLAPLAAEYSGTQWRETLISIRKTPSIILLAGMNEMFSIPFGASEPLNCDRVGYTSV